MSDEERAVALEAVRRDIVALLERLEPPQNRHVVHALTAAILLPFFERNGNGGPPNPPSAGDE